MEPTAIAATAAVISAAAAWGALASSAHRAKKDWQRDTTLRSAVHVLQLCQRRHNREHEVFDDKELTVGEVDVAYSELHAITDEVERELISVRLIADRNAVDVYVTSWWQRMDRRARAWQAKLLLG